MSELKRCPFCGGEAMLIEHTDYWGIKYGVECQGECDVSPFTSWWKHKKDAIKAWNTRKPMERIMERLLEESYDSMHLDMSTPMTETWQIVDLDKAIEIIKEEGDLNAN